MKFLLSALLLLSSNIVFAEEFNVGDHVVDNAHYHANVEIIEIFSDGEARVSPGHGSYVVKMKDLSHPIR